MKKRVTGLGGVFFKTQDPEAMKAWYNKHLHLDAGEHGTLFKWREYHNPEREGTTVWSPFPEEVLEALKAEGVQIVGEMETYPYGKFGWIMYPEGNKIELWESVDEENL